MNGKITKTNNTRLHVYRTLTWTNSEHLWKQAHERKKKERKYEKKKTRKHWELRIARWIVIVELGTLILIKWCTLTKNIMFDISTISSFFSFLFQLILWSLRTRLWVFLSVFYCERLRRQRQHAQLEVSISLRSNKNKHKVPLNSALYLYSDDRFSFGEAPR